MNIFTEHWQLAVAGFFLFFGFNLLVQSEGMKGNIIRGGKGMISDKHSAPFGVLLAVCSLCVRWYSKSTTTAARSMLGHQFHSDTTRYYGDCTYVRGCVWKMERERGRERERWEWGLDITEQETISHSGVQQRRRRRGGRAAIQSRLAGRLTAMIVWSIPALWNRRAVFWTWKPGFSRLKLEGHASHYFSQQVNQDDLHLGDKQATQAEGRDSPQLPSRERHRGTVTTQRLRCWSSSNCRALLFSVLIRAESAGIKKVSFTNRVGCLVFSRSENNIKDKYSQTSILCQWREIWAVCQSAPH